MIFKCSNICVNIYKSLKNNEVYTLILGSISSFPSSAGFNNETSLLALRHFTPYGTSFSHNICDRLGAHSFPKLPDKVHERVDWNSPPVSVTPGHFTYYTSTATSSSSRLSSSRTTISTFWSCLTAVGFLLPAASSFCFHYVISYISQFFYFYHNYKIFLYQL